MKTQKVELVEKAKVTDVLCNKCGESCKDYIVQGNTDMFNLNYAEITPNFGYGSTLYDLEDWEVHICEGCYAAFEATFKIQPEKKQTLAWG